MDKRDFYREIMEEYAFDRDKIFINAKNGKFAGNKLRRQPLPIYIGMTAAVAAVAVTVGTITMTRLGGPDIEPLPSGSSYAALEERIKRGQSDARDNEGSRELFDVLVSFERPLSSAEVQRVLLARADASVPVKALYMEDGSVVVGTENVGETFEANGGGITGAVIRCAGYLMSQLQEDSLVLAVEINGDDPELIAPIINENNSIGGDMSIDSPQFSDSGSVSSESTASVDSDSSSAVSSTEPPESTSSASTSSTDSGSVGEPPAAPAYEMENNISAIDGGYTFPITVGESGSELSVPIDVIMALPEGAELPYNPDGFSYLTEDMGAKQAYFLNDDTVYVRTENDIRLYTVSDGGVSLAASQSCAETKVFWIAENGGRLLALGSDGKLYDVDANGGRISAVSLEGAVGAGEICEIAYNEETGILALNIFDNGSYSLKIYEGGFEAANVKTLYGSPSAFSLLAAGKGLLGEGARVFFAAYSGEALKIYEAYTDGEPMAISTVQGKYAITTNAAFTHAQLKSDIVNFVFDPASYGLISVNSANVQFGAAKHCFLDSDGYYTIDNGEKTPSGGISVIARFDFKRSLSRRWLAAAENGAVRIVNGIYTERARNDYLTFETPEENASAEERMAVNAAVGLQNALAGGLCESCGITDKQTLENLIGACFGDEAAEALKQRCALGEGEALEYSNGLLYPINLSDTVLVISEETETGASGTLYINAGVFDGKTAYYSCAVKLLKNGNGYKADGVIE
ncbi:MAG: hypothetical protein NC299_02910 [Lachnospiraceae bacterium]|nr:hypothetical protein [Ruminococcus sp.]MCM1274301.1 hypothetical protein [Lachnospiraceae bacterium]